MANSVPMTTREAIRALRKRGYSSRKIARELGVHRYTVAITWIWRMAEAFQSVPPRPPGPRRAEGVPGVPDMRAVWIALHYGPKARV